jgi:tetratricopeptide (TPR) repeat protein
MDFGNQSTLFNNNRKGSKMKNSISTKLFVFFFLLGSLLQISFALTPNEQMKEGIALAKKAYVSYDKETFQKAHDIFGKIYAADSTNFPALYNLTYVEYRFLEIGSRDKALFDKYVNQAVEHAEKISSAKGFGSEGKTLLASILMMKITYNWAEAMTLSPRINALLGEAEAINPNNPRAYLIHGIMKLNTPAAFGGSVKEGLENFSKTISLFEKEVENSSSLINWGYLDALAWTGIANEKLEMSDAAIFVYKKALSIEPEYSWVKYVLLPNLEKSKNGTKNTF